MRLTGDKTCFVSGFPRYTCHDLLGLMAGKWEIFPLLYFSLLSNSQELVSLCVEPQEGRSRVGVLKSRNFDRSYLGTGGGDGSYANRLWVRVCLEGQGGSRVHLPPLSRMVGYNNIYNVISRMLDDGSSSWMWYARGHEGKSVHCSSLIKQAVCN